MRPGTRARREKAINLEPQPFSNIITSVAPAAAAPYQRADVFDGRGVLATNDRRAAVVSLGAYLQRVDGPQARGRPLIEHDVLAHFIAASARQ